MRKKEDKYDFRTFGLAIKEARIKQGLTREQVGASIEIGPRYLMDSFTEKELILMEALVNGIVESNEIKD